MSTTITTAMVDQYKANVHHLVQQKGSKLLGTVKVEPLTGESAYFDQLGATEAQEKGGRHTDSPMMNTPHDRRRIFPRTFEWGDMVDKADKLRTIIDPTNPYAVNAMWALGRKLDSLIIAAALGTAYTGRSGGTPVTFDTTNMQIVHNSVGLTVDKVIQAGLKLDLQEVPAENRHFVGGPKQKANLLATTQVTSNDYNAVKALVNGEINTFMGFTFHWSNRLTLASTTRSCLAYHGDGIAVAMAQQIMAEIAVRPDKSFGTYVYAAMDCDAARLEEKRVVEVQCTEA